MNRSEQQKILQVGGTLDHHKHLYIARTDIEEEVFQSLRKGEYCNILASRQVGKSSLMMKTVERLRQEHIRAIALDIAGNIGNPRGASEWYIALLRNIARRLAIPFDGEAWWQDNGKGTPNERLLQFFREVLFKEDQTPVVIFLDEIEATLKLPYSDDLFIVLRTMYNERVSEPVYEKITFCLLGMATPNELIKDRRTTPYNIGRTIEFRDFDLTKDDFSELNNFLNEDEEDRVSALQTILYWTGGHPYLTMLLCQKMCEVNIKESSAIEKIIHEGYSHWNVVKNDTHFGYIADFLNTRVAANQYAMIRLYECILQGKPVKQENTSVHIYLKLSGLVKQDKQNVLHVRNRIYEHVFDHDWISASKPKQAMRNLRLLVAGMGLLLLGAMGWVVTNHLMLIRQEQQRFEQLLQEFDSLHQAQDESRSQELFETLIEPDNFPHLRKRFAEYKQRAIEEYMSFWDRRSALLDERARRFLRLSAINTTSFEPEPEPEKGLLLAAAAVLKKGNAHERIAEDIVNIYYVRNYHLLERTLRCEDKCVQGAAFSPDGQYIVTGGRDRQATCIWKWNIVSPQDIMCLAMYSEAQTTVATFSHDGKYIFTGGVDSIIRVWDRNSRQKMMELQGHSNTITDLETSPDDRFIISGAEDLTARIWDMETGRALYTLRHNYKVYRVAISPDVTEALTAADKTYLWDIARGELITDFPGMTTAVAYSRNGTKWARAIFPNGDIYIHDRKDIQKIIKLNGASETLQDLEFSPDGEWLLAASQNNIIRLWNIGMQNSIKIVPPLEFGNLSSAAFSRDGSYILTVHQDGTARIWSVAAIKAGEREELEQRISPTIWKVWQYKLGLTLDEQDAPVSLWKQGLRELRSCDQERLLNLLKK